MSKFIDELNTTQQEAVKNFSGPVMVIAGAGSGKTRVLTYRIAYMIQQGVDPFNILSLTFTNKAATEMKERILKIVGTSDARNVWMGTFHSVFAKLLRIDGHRLGYDSNFTIYDTDDVKSLLKSIIKELDLDPKIYSVSYLIGRISMAKNNLISDIEYKQNNEIITADASAMKPRTGEIYSIYNNRLKRSNAMDFDDLLFYTNVLLRDFPEILYKYQQKFKYILVDEYQDTNYAQYLILKKLAAANENICVVGDDAQSIYAFRGANIQNIFNFKKDYPDYKVFKLEQNYRSTQNIVNAANSIIKHNVKQIDKTIWTSNDSGSKVAIIRASSDNDEGQKVAQSIFENRANNQLPNTSFAILYRTNAQSRAFEESLRKLNIPYKIFGGISFYKRKEVKDLLSYFRLTVNHNDEEALKRVINYPQRGIGQTTIEKIIAYSSLTGGTLWQIIEDPKRWQLPVNIPTQERLVDFASKINSFTAQLKTLNAYDLAYLISQSSGIIHELYENKEEPERYQNIEALLNAIRDFTDREETEPNIETNEVSDKEIRYLDQFLSEVSLMTDLEDDDDKDKVFDKVSLMTIHSAKGLEFPYVYIVGIEENLFPSFMSISSRAELEEERRLFYVALTRAMKRVYLSYAETRMKWGQMNFVEPSRFIDEIGEEYIDIINPRQTFKTIIKKPEAITQKPILQKPSAPTINNIKLKKINEIDKKSNTELDGNYCNPNEIQAGITVEHERFGIGTVLSIDGDNNNRKAVIFFQEIGQKTLLLHFAKLKLL